MVTAIVIPIICFYFYFLTKKEMKQNKARWLSCGQVKEESILEGIIENISYQKERYYRQYFVMVTNLQVRSNGKMHNVQFNTPITNGREIPSPTLQQQAKFYGTWNHTIFQANRFISE